MKPLRRSVLILVVAILAEASLWPVGPVIAAERPQLDEVPGPALGHQGLPAVATWPLFRYGQPLRMLAVVDKRSSAGAYLRISRRLRASLDLIYLSSGQDEIYHVNDKWIEPEGNPTREELAQYSKRVVVDTLERQVVQLSGPPQKTEGKPGRGLGADAYDVIFLAAGIDDTAVQAVALRSVSAGSRLVACGNVYPNADSPLGREWPAKPSSHNTWHSGGATRADCPAVAGLPLARLKGWRWMPLAEATAGSLALATGESGAAFLREVGKGWILFVPTGPISRHHSATELIGRQYDHDDIWLRFWDQVLYELSGEAEAIPALADLKPGPDEAEPDCDYVLAGKIVNRSAQNALAVAVHVTNPRGRIVYATEETIEVSAGSQSPYEVRVPVKAHWGAGAYPVYLTVGDPAARRQFHQAMELIPVRGQLSLTLSTGQRGYRLGEEARFELTASSSRPFHGELAFGVYDFRGRLLDVDIRQVTLGTAASRFDFAYRLADHGVRVDTFWAQVAARKDGREWGRAEVRFYNYEPWSTRHEYQWSTWAGIACGPPSLVPMGMRLMGHAGMNALGYPGRPEIHYPAERWGWRYYNENIGMNTFSPVIEYENEAEIEAALAKEAEQATDRRDLYSAAFVLGSVGEEAGFKRGWGTRYYWDTPVAPEKACRAFRWFLGQKYASLDGLNAAWKTKYRSWDEVKLTREFSPGRGGKLVELDADGWAHPKDSPLGEGVTRVTYAPVADTGEFYDWYYDKIIETARRILRERINPRAQIMASAPTIGTSRVYDVRLAGPSAWNESQWHALDDGPEPGFGLIWGHFDWAVKTDNMFWGWLLMRSGHNNYWVDVPLMFNNDLTHTRASFAMRRWTHRLAGHERVILDSRPAPSDVGLLEPNGLFQDQSRRYMAKSLQVALSQGGFGLPGTDATDLARYKILFAVARQAVSEQEAERLHAYVERGGTLVFTPRFATQSAHGVPSPTSPGCGLAKKWDFEVTGRTEAIPQYHDGAGRSFTLPWPGKDADPIQLSSFAVFCEKVRHQGWTQLAAYDDGTPAVLTRTLGKGRLVYLNAIYHSHHYIQWVTPTGPERQGFYRLIERLCEQAGAKRTLRLEGNLAELLHVAVKQFTDPTGHIAYVILRTSGEVPWVAGKLRWLASHAAAYDVFGEVADRPGGPAAGQPEVSHRPRQPLPAGREIALNFKPGSGRLLALVKRPPVALALNASPSRITSGEPLQLSVTIRDEGGQSVPGCFPLELDVTAPDGRPIQGLRRSFSSVSGDAIRLNTAIDDPPGPWTLTVTDAITGLVAVAQVDVRQPGNVADAPGFVPWGWPSELEEPPVLSAARFIDRLERLAKLYQTDQLPEDWLAKQRLGYYCDFFPETRHSLLRPVLDLDWTDYSEAVRKAIHGGATLILTGEDLGLHPGSGLPTYPHHDAKQFDAVTTALKGAAWSLATSDGDTIAATLGKGRLILCRESVDAAGHDNPSVARWQERWLGELKRAQTPLAIKEPSPQDLRSWRTGETSITDSPREIRWFAGNDRQLTLSLSAEQTLGPTFALAVPPVGTVDQLVLRATANRPANICFDVGCNGTIDVKLPAPEGPSSLDWTEQVAGAASRALYRDDNGWRIVPVRVHADSEVELTLSDLRLIVK